MLLNKTIRLFLDGIGRREEYEFYLNKFQSTGTECFALLVPDTASLEQAAEAFAFDLHFLLRLGLRPAVVLCGPEAHAQWTLLKENPLFEKAAFPNTGSSAGNVPVFIQASEKGSTAGSVCFQGLEKMIPTLGKRVHFIRAAGGFDADYYYTQKENDVVLNKDEQTLADAAAALLAARPGTHLSVTSPMSLLEEIFTVKGAGTVFRKGSSILSPDFQTLEKSRLVSLLEESFGKTPKPEALDSISRVYLEEQFRGAVLLEDHPQGLYLSKFAVGPEARGEGLAQELWDEVCKNHKAFFWRSRKGNPVNQWYDRHADGRHTAGDWIVFWRGVQPAAIPGLIAFCTSRPADFK